MSGMLDRVHDLYDELERNCVLLSFKGGLNPELISVILGLVERKLASMENDQRSRKRVFNVVVECLQNLYHHNRQKTSTDEPADQVREPQGVVMIAHTATGYSVLTGNFMAGSDVEQLGVELPGAAREDRRKGTTSTGSRVVKSDSDQGIDGKGRNQTNDGQS